ncbi:MAG: hypothetical protein HZC29_08125 [Thaumarchaeota archaeon]|nr:hypothetical protein [Nitrososphaerota archaeon]
MSVKIKDIKTTMNKENDGSYSITCSALGVYSSGKNKQDAKKNFLSALELHLSVLREKATKVITLQEKSSSKKFRF